MRAHELPGPLVRLGVESVIDGVIDESRVHEPFARPQVRFFSVRLRHVSELEPKRVTLPVMDLPWQTVTRI